MALNPEPGWQATLQDTSAMEAGLSNRLLSMEDVLALTNVRTRPAKELRLRKPRVLKAI